MQQDQAPPGGSQGTGRSRARAVVAAAAVAVAMTAAGPTPPLRASGAADGEAFSRLPDDVIVASHIDRFDAFIRWLGVIGDTIGGLPDPSNLFDLLGVDRIDPEAIRDAGLDPTGSVEVATMGEGGVGMLVSWAASSRAWKRLSRAEGFRDAREKRVDGSRLRVRPDGRAAAWFDGDRLWLLHATSDTVSIDAADLARHVMRRSRQAPLSRVEALRHLPPPAGAGPGAVVYATSRAAFDVPRLGPRMAMFGRTGAAVMRLAWDDTVLTADAWMAEDTSKVSADARRPTTDPVPFVRRLPAHPRMLVMGRTRGRVVADAMQAEPADAAKLDSSTAEAIRRVEPIVRLIDGNVGLLVESASMMAPSVTMFVQTHDPDAAHAILAQYAHQLRRSLTAKKGGEASPVTIIEDRIDGRTAWRVRIPPFYEICAGVAGDHVVLTTSWSRLLELAGDGTGASGGGPGDADARAALLEDPRAGVFIVNVGALVQDAAPMAPSLGLTGAMVLRVLSRVRMVASVARFTGDGVRLHGRVVVRDRGVWADLATLSILIQ